MFFWSRWNQFAEHALSFTPPTLEHLVSPLENNDLLTPVPGKEVRCVLWSLVEEKALGPDSFSPLFFRNYWCNIRYDVIFAV